ncbi:hypothetical protein [Halorientalis marina]|uniref:hypothetical protein n=1 Tax=Halorientalis marina TaxID=2931976 RepID=UPI001FF4B736|nr:hypothetical protein [Halorientalis marina]
MSVATRRRSRRLGLVGVVGVLVTLVAGAIETNPESVAWLAPYVSLLLRVLFVASAVLAFLTGLGVIVYTYWMERAGVTTERMYHRAGTGLCAVLACSLVFPLVVLDDLAAVLGRWLAGYGAGLPTEGLFYASLAIFGTCTLVGALGTLRFKLTARREGH